MSNPTIKPAIAIVHWIVIETQPIDVYKRQESVWSASLSASLFSAINVISVLVLESVLKVWFSLRKYIPKEDYFL